MEVCDSGYFKNVVLQSSDSILTKIKNKILKIFLQKSRCNADLEIFC